MLFFYSFKPYRLWRVIDPDEKIGWEMKQWCFSNLRRPATVTFYDNGRRFDRRARLYRRQTKMLGLDGSWSRWGNEVIEVYYEIEFEDPVDQELFLLRWLGSITIVDKLPEITKA